MFFTKRGRKMSTSGRAYVERGKAGTGLLEKIELFIPGFRGYKEKEIRRESDTRKPGP